MCDCRVAFATENAFGRMFGALQKIYIFWFSSALVLGINTLTNFTFNFIWKNASERVIGAPFFSHKSDSTIKNVHPSVSTSVSKTPQIALNPSSFIHQGLLVSVCPSLTKTFKQLKINPSYISRLLILSGCFSAIDNSSTNNMGIDRCAWVIRLGRKFLKGLSWGPYERFYGYKLLCQRIFLRNQYCVQNLTL